MAILDKILGRKKTLSDLTAQELRKEEILLGKQRDKLLTKIETIAAGKQKIFVRGSQEKSPEVRRALALDFEMKTQEQVLAGRELNLRGKELLTVTRLRMAREHAGQGAALGRLNVTDRDVAKLTQLIDDDSVTQDVYTERLNAILSAGESADGEGGMEVGPAGQELLQMWDQVDRGAMKQDAAFEKADAAVRARQSAKEI